MAGAAAVGGDASWAEWNPRTPSLSFLYPLQPRRSIAYRWHDQIAESGETININAKNVSTLIHYMEGLNDPRFTMVRVLHPCGAPACAIGHSFMIFERRGDEKTDWTSFYRRVFGHDTYWHLFSDFGHEHIHTPQQWAAHARRFLAENGFEVTEQRGPETGLDQARTHADADPVTAQADPHHDPFADFMTKVLKPVELERVR